MAKFLKTGKVQPEFPAISKYYKKICYLNKTRKIATELCCNEFDKNKEHYEVNFRHNGKIETYKVAVDMPVLVTKNMKQDNMYNMMEFKIEQIKEEIIDQDEKLISYKTNNKWFAQCDFRQSFIPAFCSTVYKYQGADIKEHYNILDVNRMDKKQLYTCLSRTTRFEYIHLDNQFLNAKYFIRRQPNIELLNSHFNSYYLYGKIYKVRSENCDKVGLHVINWK